MRANLDLTHGALFSQRVLLALVEQGRSRDEAYRIVQEDAQRAWDSGVQLRDLLAARDSGSTSTRSSTSRTTRARRAHRRAPRRHPGAAPAAARLTRCKGRGAPGCDDSVPVESHAEPSSASRTSSPRGCLVRRTLCGRRAPRRHRAHRRLRARAGRGAPPPVGGRRRMDRGRDPPRVPLRRVLRRDVPAGVLHARVVADELGDRMVGARGRLDRARQRRRRPRARGVDPRPERDARGQDRPALGRLLPRQELGELRRGRGLGTAMAVGLVGPERSLLLTALPAALRSRRSDSWC